MKKYIFKHAVIGSAALIVLGLLNWWVIAPYFTVAISQTLGYLGIILSLMSIPMGIKHYRDQLNNGEISFGQGFKIGISITFIISIIMYFYGMLFFIFEGDKFMEWQFKDLQGEELEAMQAQLAAMPEFAMKPWFQGVIMFAMVFTIGTIMTMLGAFILKRNAD